MPETRDDGGAAFPTAFAGVAPGMSLRDWFAGQAMIALTKDVPPIMLEKLGELAYRVADAMLEARKR